MPAVMAQESFEERQKELCLLSSFISEQEEWLQSWLSALGWTLESLQRPELVQCPFNPNHYLPPSSMDEHKKKCRYASLADKDMHALDWEEISELNADVSFIYKNSSIESVSVGEPVKQAVRRLAADLPEVDRVSRLRGQHETPEEFSSLEETQLPPTQMNQFQGPSQLISYIKSWKKVPSDFAQVDSSSLNLGKVKGWLFENLPKQHAHSTTLGGEITVVDSIMACLVPPSVSRNKRLMLSPNVLMNKLQPLLGINARSLVLNLWKFLHTARLQKEHGLTDSHVSEIAALPQSAVEGMRAPVSSEQGQSLPSIANLVKGLMKPEDTPTCDGLPLPLPPARALEQLTPLERRILYDYVVEVTSQQAYMKLDPELYRDDMAVIKAKLKAQAKLEAASAKKDEEKEVDTRGKTYLQLLKEKRDYKRRRQKYRAKNVHVTRRTPTEIFRTIINNRMEELKVASQQPDSDVDRDLAVKEAGRPPAETPERKLRRERDQSREGDRGRRRDRSHSREREHRRKHRRSRSRRRSGSRRRRRSRSESCSRKRERSRSRKREKRSRSREKTRKHKKHRKRSRSKS